MDSLTSIVEENFGYLIEDYGFSLTTKNPGKEIHFKFERGLKTISIFMEMGCKPDVRIYGPCSQFGGEIVSFAEKDGINRGMRHIKPHQQADSSDIETYLKEIAESLLKDEREWLEH